MIARIKQHKVFLFFLFLFSWVLVLKNQIRIGESWESFVFHWDAPFWTFINSLVILSIVEGITRKSQAPTDTESPQWDKYFSYLIIGLLIYLFLANALGLSMGLLFGTLDRNYNSSFQITYKIFYQIIDFLIFGGFTLAYKYFRENQRYKQRMTRYELSASQSKIQQLKAQLNPHFLFNNLNILDQLIHEDTEEASEFLSDFAELYRYILKHANHDLVPLKEELEFAQLYFEMMQRKYEGYYSLSIRPEAKEVLELVPPFCLQILIENAIIHNQGTTEHPVSIDIDASHQLTVTNNRVLGNNSKKHNGIALKNLHTQYELLTGTGITIKTNASEFKVQLPLISSNPYD